MGPDNDGYTTLPQTHRDIRMYLFWHPMAKPLLSFSGPDRENGTEIKKKLKTKIKIKIKWPLVESHHKVKLLITYFLQLITKISPIVFDFLKD